MDGRREEWRREIRKVDEKIGERSKKIMGGSGKRRYSRGVEAPPDKG